LCCVSVLFALFACCETPLPTPPFLRKMKTILLVALLVASAIAAPIAPTPPPPETKPVSFNYNQGGKDWTGTCATGQAQSPININSSATVCVRHGEEAARQFRIDFHYADNVSNMTLINTGNTLKVKGDLGYVTIGGCNPCNGQEYRVKQFRFHAPSEHTIDTTATKSGAYVMELQIYHQKVGSTGLNDIVAVSILFYVQPEGGFPNWFLDNINWNILPTTKGQATALTGGVNLRKLDEALVKGEYYTYKGSLTTPPCTESVQWFVMKTPLGVTQSQLNSIQAVFQKNTAFANGNGNNRLVQPVNNRQVTWYRRRH
jgi:carbonic anhydrase